MHVSLKEQRDAYAGTFEVAVAVFHMKRQIHLYEIVDAEFKDITLASSFLN